MFISLGDNPVALQIAAGDCGLEIISGPALFHYKILGGNELPKWVRDLGRKFDPSQAEYVLRLKPEDAALCSRRPHEVGVFSRFGQMYAIWDENKDGYGLNAFIGHYGERLRTFYVISALERLCFRLGLSETKYEVDGSETLTLECTDPMSQKKIIVRVAKNGDTVIKTEGFEGTACKDATKQLEKALGTVVSDQATQEMYSPPEQTTTIGSS